MLMKRQTKNAVMLAASALFSLGLSFTSFAALGWVEENGSWAYYDRDGIKATDDWKKSGDNWFYLDSDGYMVVDSLIEDNDNYFYVSSDGRMLTNQWAAVDNENYSDEDEPESYWYYFQSNGKAYKSGNSDRASIKEISGKKYIFDEEGRMQYGWVNESGERQTDDDQWQNGVYYCGDQNDGALTIGWKDIYIHDPDWNPDAEINGHAFEEDQTRWFYFKPNGKKHMNDQKTINGRKYRFDEYGRMIAEWWTSEIATTSKGKLINATPSDTSGKKMGSTTKTGQGSTDYTTTWKYYGTPEDGAASVNGWFQVIPSDYLNSKDSDDYKSAWYYSDGKGNLIANQFKTINGKKYAFDSYGRMLTGLKIIQLDSGNRSSIKDIFDKGNHENEEDFESFIKELIEKDYQNVYVYYFAGKNDGSMLTGKQTITLDDQELSFEFEKNGSRKGRGKSGLIDKKFYIGGKLTKADSEQKYELAVTFTDGTALVYEGWDLLQELDLYNSQSTDNDDIIYFDEKDGDSFKAILQNKIGSELSKTVSDYYLVNTSGNIIKSKSKCSTGDDLIFTVHNNKITKIYEEQ